MIVRDMNFSGRDMKFSVQIRDLAAPTLKNGKSLIFV